MFYAAFGLRDTAGFQLNTKLLAGISELGIGILIKRWGVFLFIGKYRTAVCEDPVRDAVGGQDLVEYVIVAL